MTLEHRKATMNGTQEAQICAFELRFFCMSYFYLNHESAKAWLPGLAFPLVVGLQ